MYVSHNFFLLIVNKWPFYFISQTGNFLLFQVRQQLAEQLAVSKSLTHKTVDAASSDDDDENKQEIPDLTLSQDPTNPWMMKRSDKDNVDSEFDFGYKKYLKDKMLKRKEMSDSESDNENAENTTKTNGVLDILKKSVSNLSDKVSETQDETTNNIVNDQPKRKKSKSSKTTKLLNKPEQVSENTVIVATNSNWTVEFVNICEGKASEDISNIFESFENKVVNKVTKKLKKLKKDIDKTKKEPKLRKERDTGKSQEAYGVDYYEFKKTNEKPVIDEPLLETDGKTNDADNEPKSLTKILTSNETQENTNANIDPSRFIVVKPKYLNTALPKDVNEYDELDDDEQVVPRIDIEEVFEEDDVVDSFRQEKEDEINKDKPKDIDLSLPGWGQWGGKGVKAPKRKKNRFILKAPPCTLRRDENKGDIIIKEYKDPKLAVHKVTDLPFPFKTVKDYEASLRAPLGNTFITEKAYKKLIQPNVLTKAGTVIQPMDEDELLLQKHQKFNNDPIIKLLGQK